MGAEIEKLKKDQVEMKNVLEKVQVQTDKKKILKEKTEKLKVENDTLKSKIAVKYEELNSEIEEHKKNMDKMKNEITKLEKDHETTNEKNKAEINLKIAEIEKLKKDQVEMKNVLEKLQVQTDKNIKILKEKWKEENDTLKSKIAVKDEELNSEIEEHKKIWIK